MQRTRVRRVFLLDSHEIFRKGVRVVLDDQPGVEVVGESSSFTEAVAQISAAGPHVAVVGIREHERADLAQLNALRDSDPPIHLLVLTRTVDEEALAAAMRVGASGYLSKDIPAAQLVKAVHSVAEGHDVIDSSRAMSLLDRTRNESTVGGEDPLSSLTRQERKILDLIAEGLSNRQIAEQLFLVEKTVRNHVTRVLSKLGVERRTQAALIAARIANGRTHHR